MECYLYSAASATVSVFESKNLKKFRWFSEWFKIWHRNILRAHVSFNPLNWRWINITSPLNYQRTPDGWTSSYHKTRQKEPDFHLWLTERQMNKETKETSKQQEVMWTSCRNLSCIISAGWGSEVSDHIRDKQRQRGRASQSGPETCGLTQTVVLFNAFLL